MAMTSEQIVAAIKKSIPDATVRIRDLAGDGEHYACEVYSPAFAGLSRVRQHQMVYDSFGGEMGTKLHALALKTGVSES